MTSLASFSFSWGKDWWYIPQSFVKQCQVLRQTMRRVLQDLALKSIKGLGTKACTNWEDGSTSSLAYQGSNHSIFLYTESLSLQSFHLMKAIFAQLQRIQVCLTTSGWRVQNWWFWAKHAGEYFLQPFLNNNLDISPEHDIQLSATILKYCITISVPPLSTFESAYLSVPIKTIGSHYNSQITHDTTEISTWICV